MLSDKLKSEDQYEIWTNNLTKIYGRRKTGFRAVDRINIQMEPGIHGFLGPNGAGKTSTINMLIGAISISEGSAKIRGMKAGSTELKKLIGYLPQDPAFYKNMTGMEYLVYQAQLNGISKKEAKRKTLELLNYFDLEDAKDRIIEKYSGGMKQKIGLAASFIHDPKILILDEPTANLDPIGRQNIINHILELSETMSIFVSSHVLSEVEQMCEKVTIINKGRIVLTDTIKDIKKLYSVKNNYFILDTSANALMLKELERFEFISDLKIDEEDDKIHFFGSDEEKIQEAIPKILVEKNIRLKSFFQPESSLQEIFVNLIEKEGK